MIARRLFVWLGVLVVAALAAAPLAFATESANIIEPQNNPGSAEDGWTSANCTSDAPIKCSPATPELYFTPAGGHPQIGYTQYIIQHEETVKGVLEPIKAPKADRTIKTLHVELPPGLTVNPLATERCTLAEFQNKEGGENKPLCKPGTIVGYEEATLVTNNGTEGVPPLGIPAGTPEGVRVDPIEGFTKVPVYALVPAYGEPALNAFLIAGKKEVFLETDVAWQSDFHESFTIKMPENAPQPEPPFSTLISRQVSFGKAGNGTYITNPTTCYDPEDPPYPNVYAAIFKAESYGEEDPLFPSGTTGIPAAFPKGLKPTGCPAVPFDPAIEVAPGTTAVDSPAPATVETTLPFLTGGETLSESHLRNAKVVLPVGMGLNPAATSGNLVACTDAQFKQKGSRAPVECPAASKIGTVAIETPPLPAGSLTGNIYLGRQLSRDPASGEEFRFFIDAEAPEQGISVRLLGKTRADPITGQLTTELNENPQTPFTSVKLTFDGPENVLTSPSVCAPAQTTSVLEPWSTPASTKTPSSSFTLSSDPGGGTCPTTLGRKFAPAYSAVNDVNEAGGFSPFRIHVGRSDGQQELKGINVTLPQGLTGKLAGIPYCSDAALVAASANSGKAELAGSSCPAESQIGTTSTESGSGAHPVKLAGKAFLAGPYKGAPVSLAIITPAVSGPFDLGTVVVRVALNVDPVTAQINAVSDAIPDVFGGVKLDIRSIDVNMDRSQFMLNPTHCGKQEFTTGLINGGGADPTNPAAWSSYPISTPFQTEGCRKLGFKPKLHVRLFGKTTRAQNPRIRAVLEARPGDANIARTALILPHSLFLDQSHIKTVCIRPKLAAHECPQNSIYGHAEATSPLLSNKLAGPVYLVPSNHRLPDLVADLRGQIEIQLHGVVGSKHGGLKTVFNSPDVPVSKFVLDMKGGKKSLIVNSTDTCKARQTAVLHFRAHNSKRFETNKLPLAISGCQIPKGKRGK